MKRHLIISVCVCVVVFLWLRPKTQSYSRLEDPAGGLLESRQSLTDPLFGASFIRIN